MKAPINHRTDPECRKMLEVCFKKDPYSRIGFTMLNRARVIFTITVEQGPYECDMDFKDVEFMQFYLFSN